MEYDAKHEWPYRVGLDGTDKTKMATEAMLSPAASGRRLTQEVNAWADEVEGDEEALVRRSAGQMRDYALKVEAS